MIDEPSDNDANTDDEDLDFDLSGDLGDESLPPQYDDDSYDNDANAPSQPPVRSLRLSLWLSMEHQRWY